MEYWFLHNQTILTLSQQLLYFIKISSSWKQVAILGILSLLTSIFIYPEASKDLLFWTGISGKTAFQFMVEPNTLNFIKPNLNPQTKSYLILYSFTFYWIVLALYCILTSSLIFLLANLKNSKYPIQWSILPIYAWVIQFLININAAWLTLKNGEVAWLINSLRLLILVKWSIIVFSIILVILLIVQRLKNHFHWRNLSQSLHYKFFKFIIGHKDYYISFYRWGIPRYYFKLTNPSRYFFSAKKTHYYSAQALIFSRHWVFDSQGLDSDHFNFVASSPWFQLH